MASRAACGRRARVRPPPALFTAASRGHEQQNQSGCDFQTGGKITCPMTGGAACDDESGFSFVTNPDSNSFNEATSILPSGGIAWVRLRHETAIFALASMSA